MVDRVRERWVTPLPPTAGIQDPQVRAYLDAFTNAWQLRNGEIGATEDARFVTKGEMKEVTASALAEIFASGGSAIGPGGGNPGAPGSRLPALLDNLATWVLGSELYRRLSARIDNLEVPWDTLNRIEGLVTQGKSQLTRISSILGFPGTFPPGVTSFWSYVNNTATDLTVLTSTVGNNSSSIIDLQQTTASQATQISSLQTTTNTHASSIFSLQQTTAQSALDIDALEVTATNLGGRLTTAEGQISEINNVTVTSTSVAAQQLAQVRSTLTSTPGPISRTIWQADEPAGGGYIPGDVWIDTDTYTRYAWNGSAWIVGTYTYKDFVDAGFASEVSTRSTKDNALAGAVNTIWAILSSGQYNGSSSAIIQDSQLASVSVHSASATQWNSLQAAVFSGSTNLVAQLRQDFDVFVDADHDRASATYTVRTDVNGIVAGFGLMQYYSGGSMFDQGVISSFGVLASAFWIAGEGDIGVETPDPNKVPFVVLTVPTSINGVTYPAGAWLNGETFIADATIRVAKIEDSLESMDWAPGVSGWFIGIRGSDTGYAEFNNCTIRGTSTVGRLNVTGSVFGSQTITAAADGTVYICVNHNENRHVQITYWTNFGTPSISHNDAYSFCIRVTGYDGLVTIYYRYF